MFYCFTTQLKCVAPLIPWQHVMYYSLLNPGKSTESSFTKIANGTKACKGNRHFQCMQRNIWVLCFCSVPNSAIHEAFWVSSLFIFMPVNPYSINILAYCHCLESRSIYSMYAGIPYNGGVGSTPVTWWVGTERHSLSNVGTILYFGVILVCMILD